MIRRLTTYLSDDPVLNDQAGLRGYRVRSVIAYHPAITRINEYTVDTRGELLELLQSQGDGIEVMVDVNLITS